jgi:hypothetical protein
MALEHLKPEIWSRLLLKRLNDALGYRNVCTTEYEKEITQFGDVIKINEIGTIAVNSYSNTSTSALTIQTLTDAQKLLNIDRAKYTAFWVDDEDRAQIKGDAVIQAIQQQAWSLANEVDEYIAGKHLEAGITVTGTWAAGTDVTSTNVLKYVSLIAQKHDEANTPMNGRWIVVPPWFYQKMLLSKIALDTQNTAVLGTGAVGNYMGFDIYVSNNVPHGSGTDRAAVLSGYRGSIALATQILKSKSMDTIEIGFKRLFKSLMVYGAKVIRPNNLAVAYVDYIAEAT